MTFYLKYRSKTINELDLALVRERLSKIVEKKNFSHAYLFHGPRGTGKTSAARIMAWEAGVDKQDIIELDAASHRGIDDVRELRERVGLTPTAGDKKAYIIDEVHMLTTEAFNALLKTLEEPPSHVIFFLCTTELSKLPQTIVSRCVNIPFSMATKDEIIRSLVRTVKGEKIKINKEAVEAIVDFSEGSFREAQTILEEAAGFAGGKKEVTRTEVEKVIGRSVLSQVNKYVQAIIEGDAETALLAVAGVVSQGGSINNFARLILEELRNKLIFETSQGLSSKGGQSLRRLLEVIRTVEERVRTIKYTLIPQLPLEIAALELAQGQELGVRSKEVDIGNKKPEVRNQKSDTETDKESDGKDSNLAMKSASPKLQRGEQCSNVTISFSEFCKKWPEILARIKMKNHGIVTLLSHCRPVSMVENIARVEVKYKFHQEQLQQDRFRKIIDQILEEVYGNKLRLKFYLKPQTQVVLKKQANDDNISAVGDSDLADMAEEVFKL